MFLPLSPQSDIIRHPPSLTSSPFPTTLYSHPRCAQIKPIQTVTIPGCFVLFMSALLCFCDIWFCLIKLAFLVHAELSHAVTHSAFLFISRRVSRFHPLSSTTISSCVQQNPVRKKWDEYHFPAIPSKGAFQLYRKMWKTSWKQSFSFRVVGSTDLTLCAQLLAFVRYIHSEDIKEEFLFCEEL